MITLLEIEDKLERLRKEYKEELVYVKREIIKRQARALQIAKEKITA